MSKHRTIARTGLAALACTSAACAFATPSDPPEITGEQTLALSCAVPHEVGAGPFTKVYAPPPGPDGSARYVNDHTFIRSANPKSHLWHLFGISGFANAPGVNELQFAHATDAVLHPSSATYRDQGYALTADPTYGETAMWAPHVILSGGTYYMFYCGGGLKSGTDLDWQIRLATSPDLKTWTKQKDPLFIDSRTARDPFVTRVGGQWVMYYTATAYEGGSGTDDPHVVAYRTTTDLRDWSNSPKKIAYTDTETIESISTTESPQVIELDGLYYLFVGPRGGYDQPASPLYANTEVYRSADPFHFEPKDLVGRIPAHAPEIVTDVDGTRYISSAGWYGNVGVQLAQLYVTPATCTSTDVTPTLPWKRVGNDADGRAEIFMRGTDARIYHQWQTGSADGAYNGTWTPLGTATFTGDPVVARHEDGRMVVFAVGGDGHLYASSQVAINAEWSSWADLTSGENDAKPHVLASGSAPAVETNADGSLEVFARTTAGTIVHKRQVAPNGAWLTHWVTIDGLNASADPAAAHDLDGRVSVFAVDTDGRLQWSKQAAPTGQFVAPDGPQTRSTGQWTQWSLLRDGCLGTPTVIGNDDGRNELFVRRADGTVEHTWQGTPSGAYVSDWPSMGPIAMTSNIAAARSEDGRIEVFARGVDGNPYHQWQVAKNWVLNGTWTARGGYGTGDPQVGRWADGRLELYFRSPNMAIYRTAQTGPNAPFSGYWTSLGGASAEL
jgi:hypothetical protein